MSDVEISAFLAAYPPPVRRTTDALRCLVLRQVPTAEAHLRLGWKALVFHDPQAGMFCSLFPFVHEVRLYVEHGAALEAQGHDPSGLFAAGTLKRGRMIPFAPGAALPRRELARLLRAAVLFGSL